ncbi:MAG: hypothetical protein IJ386_02195 [Clostridia bacterium]|nr:hypothetical protein [Clostridia bacterium]
MRLSLLGVGLFFLLNPIIGVHDYLPDFMGCFLIMAGIRDAAYMIEQLERSKRWFGYGALISIARTVVSLLGVDKVHTLPLTLAFTMAVLEMIVYIPAFKFLFSGFDYAAMRHGGSGILSMGRHMGIYTDESGVRQYGEIQEDTTGKLTGALSGFIIFRAVMSVVPELPALQLSESENLGDVSAFQFSSIGTLIRTAVSVAVIIYGVAVLVKYLRFLYRVHKSGDFVPGIRAELDSRFGDLCELHLSSRMRILSLLSGAAVLLYMGLYNYQINIIPRAIPALVLIAASVILAVSAKGKRLVCLVPVIPAIAVVPLSIKTYMMQKAHYYIYKIQMQQMFDEAVEFVPDRHINEMTEEYLPMAVWESAEALVLGAAMVLFLWLYLRTAISHSMSFKSVPERDREPLKGSLKLRGGLMIAGAALSAVYFTAYRFILPYFDGAAMVGIAVNILSFALYVSFALQANQYVYGNNYEV